MDKQEIINSIKQKAFSNLYVLKHHESTSPNKLSGWFDGVYSTLMLIEEIESSRITIVLDEYQKTHYNENQDAIVHGHPYHQSFNEGIVWVLNHLHERL